MRVAITGSDGFIGHHICNAFLDAGWSVLGIDDGQANARLTPARVEFLPTNTRRLTTGPLADVDFVVHAAARADVSLNWQNRAQRDYIWRENIEGTIGLLEAMPDVPMVFLSTGAVYGDSPRGREDEAQVATSPYAASKLAGEALVQAYAFKRKQPYWVFRLGCVVGSGYHHGHIADMVHAARKGRFHAKNEGRTRKSFVHVADVAAATLRTATRYDNLRPHSGVINLAVGAWGWRDTLEVMRREEPSTEFDVTYEDRVHGWVGDPMAVLDGDKARRAGFVVSQAVGEGVRDALHTLGWGRQ